MLGISAIAIATAAIATSMYAMKYASNYRPNPKKIQTDLALLQSEVNDWVAQLVPWSAEERALLSYHQIHQEVKKKRLVTAKGIFTSIYEEPVILYNYKKYIDKLENAILYARTSDRTYIYRIRHDGTTIYLNGQLIGLYDPQKRLLTPKNRLLATVDASNYKENMPVTVEGREVGSIYKLKKPAVIHVRVFDLLDSDISQREESIFLALAIFEMVHTSLKE